MPHTRPQRRMPAATKTGSRLKQRSRRRKQRWRLPIRTSKKPRLTRRTSRRISTPQQQTKLQPPTPSRTHGRMLVSIQLTNPSTMSHPQLEVTRMALLEAKTVKATQPLVEKAMHPKATVRVTVNEQMEDQSELLTPNEPPL